MIRFGPFQVDPRTWTLSRDGAVLDLSPRLVEILGYLAAKGGEIVTKDNEGGLCVRCHRLFCEEDWKSGTDDLCLSCGGKA